eukprot:TRINITY_DN2348_c0_g1_i1.p1 TRINITY_DN2348_c0_g1~~TRINITY_DN2348_c0_g1_i1.p1  ORF type:complete len:527 (+),score=123.45 TRINITY_DN2348_c0_g1_i1:102-1682(+)
MDDRHTIILHQLSLKTVQLGILNSDTAPQTLSFSVTSEDTLLNENSKTIFMSETNFLLCLSSLFPKLSSDEILSEIKSYNLVLIFLDSLLYYNLNFHVSLLKFFFGRFSFHSLLYLPISTLYLNDASPISQFGLCINSTIPYSLTFLPSFCGECLTQFIYDTETQKDTNEKYITLHLLEWFSRFIIELYRLSSANSNSNSNLSFSAKYASGSLDDPDNSSSTAANDKYNSYNPNLNAGNEGDILWEKLEVLFNTIVVLINQETDSIWNWDKIIANVYKLSNNTIQLKLLNIQSRTQSPSQSHNSSSSSSSSSQSNTPPAPSNFRRIEKYLTKHSKAIHHEEWSTYTVGTSEDSHSKRIALLLRDHSILIDTSYPLLLSLLSPAFSKYNNTLTLTSSHSKLLKQKSSDGKKWNEDEMGNYGLIKWANSWRLVGRNLRSLKIGEGGGGGEKWKYVEKEMERLGAMKGGVKEEWMEDKYMEDLGCCECGKVFGGMKRRHHCRKCGWVYCANCCPTQSKFNGERRCTMCC